MTIADSRVVAFAVIDRSDGEIWSVTTDSGTARWQAENNDDTYIPLVPLSLLAEAESLAADRLVAMARMMDMGVEDGKRIAALQSRLDAVVHLQRWDVEFPDDGEFSMGMVGDSEGDYVKWSDLRAALWGESPGNEEVG